MYLLLHSVFPSVKCVSKFLLSFFGGRGVVVFQHLSFTTSITLGSCTTGIIDASARSVPVTDTVNIFNKELRLEMIFCC